MGKWAAGMVGRYKVTSSGIGRFASFTCNKIWINILFFSTALFGHFEPENAIRATTALYHVSITTLAASLLLCAILHARIVPLLEHRPVEYVGPAVSGIGIMLLMISQEPGNGPFTAGSILTGCGSCVTLLSIGKRFAMTDSASCTAEVLSACALAAILSYIVMGQSSAIAAVISIALPFLAIAALHLSSARRFVDDRSEDLEVRPSGEYLSGKLVSKFVPCVATFGIIGGIMYDFCAPSTLGEFNQTFYIVAFCGIVSLCVPLLISHARGISSPIESLYRLTILICTASLALIPLFELGFPILYSTVSVGYTLFEIFIWVILTEVAHRFQYTSVQVFGYGRALVLIVGVIAGSIIAIPLSKEQPDIGSVLSLVEAVAIVLIVVLRIYVLTERDLSLFERDLSGLHEACENADPSEKRRVGDGTEQSPRKIPFQRKCGIIGEYYGLTRREIDVFRLLAAGRNSARIQEELSISPGTVNTHSRHVFQKLGVHRQQEVIDLFEQADIDLMQEEIKLRASRCP